MPAPVADPALIAAVQDVLKEVWPSDELQDQLLNSTVVLDWVDDVTEYTDSDGLKASVPLRTGRTGGISSRGIGQKLGAAGRQRVAKASYNYTHHYLTVKVLGPVIARMRTQRQACIKELDLEVNNGLEDLRQDWQRQLHMDGSAAIAKMSSSSSSTTINFDMTHAATKHAVEIGWIYEGMNIQIGSLASPTASSDGATIQSINPTAGTAVISGSNVSVTAGHFLFRYGNRDNVGSYEMNGLGNIVSDDTATVGGINPASASYWKPTIGRNSGTLRANSIDLMLRLENDIRRKGGKTELLIGDLDQERRYYNVLYPSVRYAGDKSLSGGNAEGLDFHGKTFKGDPHCLPNRILYLNKSAFAMYSAGEVAWQNQTTGGDILAWVQDEDAFVARAAKYCQLGTDRRNTLGELGDLLAT